MPREQIHYDTQINKKKCKKCHLIIDHRQVTRRESHSIIVSVCVCGSRRSPLARPFMSLLHTLLINNGRTDRQKIREPNKEMGPN